MNKSLSRESILTGGAEDQHIPLPWQVWSGQNDVAATVGPILWTREVGLFLPHSHSLPIYGRWCAFAVLLYCSHFQTHFSPSVFTCETESSHCAFMSIKYCLTLVNYDLTGQSYREWVKRDMNRREEVRSNRRRSAVRGAGSLERAVSFWSERRLPLPRQSSGGPSTFGE